MRRRSRARLVVGVLCVFVAAAGCTKGTPGGGGTTGPVSPATASSPSPSQTGQSRAASSSGSTAGASPAEEASQGAAQRVDRTQVFGQSVRGVPLRLVELGDPRRPGVLVVGCIHGSEAAGIAVVNALLARGVPARVHLWLVASLNPDGQAADRRTNADGVDLNRNFPYRWQPLQRPGGANYSGPGPASEPESQAMAALLRGVHPAVGVWFHQSLNVIDVSQGPRAIEDQLSAALHVKELSLADYPGSAIGFEDALFPHSAFAFELPPGAVTSSRAQQIAAAIVAVASSL